MKNHDYSSMQKQNNKNIFYKFSYCFKNLLYSLKKVQTQQAWKQVVRKPLIGGASVVVEKVLVVVQWLWVKGRLSVASFVGLVEVVTRRVMR